MSLISPLNVLVYQAVPMVWDESLSPPEFLAATVAKVNEMAAALNVLLGSDLQAQVQAVLDIWETDGTMTTLLGSLLTDETAAREAADTAMASDIITLQDDVDALEAKTASIKTYSEIEPEDLRLLPGDTDAELLQRAIDYCEDNDRLPSIKLGRKYLIDESVLIRISISYVNEPHILIVGKGGGLELAANVFMFDGTIQSGGLHFQNVKFYGNAFSAPLFNCDNLIQLVFEGCQFAFTGTVLFANTTDGFLQSCHFHNCNFKGMQTYQIKAAMIFDMIIDRCFVEWGAGGLIQLTNASLSNYAGNSLRITNNVIEGISGMIPIALGAAFNVNIDRNYFEGNTYPDIVITAAINNRSLKIRDNFFGNWVESANKAACVKPGKMYASYNYDFSGNTCTQVIFDFDGCNGGLVNLMGGDANYINEEDVVIMDWSLLTPTP